MDAHDELCCRLCDLTFRTPGGLETHYTTTQSLHARCSLCGAGFRNVIALNKVRCIPSLPSLALMVVQHVCPLGQTQADSVVSTPITQRSLSLEDTAPPSPLAHPRGPHDRTFKNVEALSTHFRAPSVHSEYADSQLGFEDNAAYDHVSKSSWDSCHSLMVY